MDKFIVVKRSKFDAADDTPHIVIGEYIIIIKNISDYAMTTQVIPREPTQYQLNGQDKFAHL